MNGLYWERMRGSRPCAPPLQLFAPLWLAIRIGHANVLVELRENKMPPKFGRATRSISPKTKIYRRARRAHPFPCPPSSTSPWLAAIIACPSKPIQLAPSDRETLWISNLIRSNALTAMRIPRSPRWTPPCKDSDGYHHGCLSKKGTHSD